MIQQDTTTQSASMPTGARPAQPATLLGTAAVFLLMSAILRGAMDVTYLIGAIQYRLPLEESIKHLGLGIYHIVMTCLVFRPLRRGDARVRKRALVNSSIIIVATALVLNTFVKLRSQGYVNTEVQIVLLSLIVTTLLITILYLWRGRNEREVDLLS